MKNIIITSSLITLLVFSINSPLDVESNQKVTTVVIDAGHGGKDPGALGKKSRESKIALAVAKKVGGYIKKYLDGVNVVYTRDSDEFVELHKRATIANENGADLFISIHCNTCGAPSVQGTETFTMGLYKDNGNLNEMKKDSSFIAFENGVVELEENQEKYEDFDNSPEYFILRKIQQSTNISNSINFAEKVENQFKNRVSRKSRGVKQAGLLVLWKTTMPSALVEIGFLSNSDEEKYLLSENGQDLLASGIYRAVKEYKKELEAQ